MDTRISWIDEWLFLRGKQDEEKEANKQTGKNKQNKKGM